MTVDSAVAEISIDGKVLGALAESAVTRTVVDEHHFLPSGCTVEFADVADGIASEASLHIGARLEVRVSGARGPAGQLFDGEITGLEGRFDPSGRYLVARAYDRAHRLHRGRITRGYENVTDSQIAEDVARRHGLGTGGIERTDVRHEQVSQVNLTDWEFLSARANELGFEVAVRDGDLVFAPSEDARRGPEPRDVRDGGTDTSLVLGDNLRWFRPRLTSSQQVSDVEVRGWDPERKRGLVGRGRPNTASADLETRPEDLASTFGSATHVQSDRPLATQAEVDAVAEGVSEHITSAFVQAEGSAYGDPAIRAGTSISVGNVGETFDGRYTVSRVRHIFENEYRTRFTVSGRQDRSLLGLVSLGRSNGSLSAGGRPVQGVVIATVANVKDPRGQGRVRLIFPWLSDEYVSPWARVVQAGAGDGRGWHVVPEVGDEVLVAFEQGDVRRPYVIGGLYNGQDRASGGDGAVDQDRGTVDVRSFTSRSGHRLEFDDTSGSERIVVVDRTGNNRIVIDSKEDALTIACDGDLTIDAGRGLRLTAGADVTIEAGGAFEVDARADAKVTAATSLDLEGSGSAALKGAQVEVNGTGSGTVKAGGVLEVQGSMVKIN